jgi:hypothetical protein
MKKLTKTLWLVVSMTLSVPAAENPYVQEYGSATLVPASQAYPDFCAPPAFVPVSGDVHVVIASDNPVKVNAVKELFARNPRFGHVEKTFYPIKVSSEIADQPIGRVNGSLGALNRIKQAKRWADIEGFSNVYVCGIENYFEAPPRESFAEGWQKFLKNSSRNDMDPPRDHAFVLVQNPDGQLFEAISVGVAITWEAYDEAIKYMKVNEVQRRSTGYSKTIGAYLHERYGFDKSDWFKEVGAGIDRIEQILTTLDDAPWF